MQITAKDIQQFRERAKTELQSNGAVGRLAWDAVVNALCNEVEELRKNAAPGNASAMRDAILAIKSVNDRRPHDAAGYEINDIIEEALAAPARNCDRPECRTEEGASATYIAEHPHAVEPDASTYGSWLLATAEGGVK